MLVDEQKLIYPFRVKKANNKFKHETHQFSDHNTLLVTFNATFQETRNNNKAESVHGWRLTKKGLKNFKELTSAIIANYLRE